MSLLLSPGITKVMRRSFPQYNRRVLWVLSAWSMAFYVDTYRF